MGQEAIVSYSSTVPIWRKPKFLEICQEGATELHRRYKSISLRFVNARWAELAWRNLVFTQLLYDDGNKRRPLVLVVRMAPGIGGRGGSGRWIILREREVFIKELMFKWAALMEHYSRFGNDVVQKAIEPFTREIEELLTEAPDTSR